MKILFVTPSYKPAFIYGGPAVSVSELAESLVQVGHSVTVYTTTANGTTELEVNTGVPVEMNGVVVYYFKRQTGDHTHVSFGLWRKLWSTVRTFDVVHLQSWWSILILGAGAICQLRNQAYFISPRGMLSEYSFAKQNSLSKKWIHRLLGHRLLRKSYLHATTDLEWQDCQKVVPGWKGMILPNIVRFPVGESQSPNNKGMQGPLTLGFLSRVDPKKGLEILFEALTKINFDFRLRIAGKGEPDYLQSLKALTQELGISNRIEWCGWMDGDAKFSFLKTIDVFVLTSYNENFANAVIESLLVGTPVLLSQEVGLAGYVEKNAFGWICERKVDSVRECLQIISANRIRLAEISLIAPQQVRHDFNHITLANHYSEAYEQFTKSRTNQ